MRILVPTDVFPPYCGGSGWSAYYLVKALKEKHDVTVIVSKPNVSGIARGRYEGIDIIYIGYKTSKLPLLGNYYKNEVFWRDFGEFLTWYLEREHYDIIHAQHQMTIIPSITVGRKLSIPVVSTVRDYWPVCYFGTLGISHEKGVGCECQKDKTKFPLTSVARIYMKKNLKRKQNALRDSCAIIAVSNFVKNSIVSVVDSNKISVIPNFFDANLKSTEGDYMLYIGNLKEEKGVLFLLDVLRKTKPKIQTIFIGDGPLKNRLEREENIKVLGRLSHDETMKYLANCNLLVFPSLWHEPLSRVLIEAASIGKPIIATNTGGTEDIIKDRETGLLSNVDVNEFSKKLSKLLSDPALRRRLARNARQGAERNFSKGVVIKKVESLYNSLLKQ